MWRVPALQPRTMLEGLPTLAQLMPELDMATIEQIAAPDRSDRYLSHDDDE